MTLPKSILEAVERFAKAKGLKKKEKEKLLKAVEEWYRKAQVEPWEAVGLIAAQSLGEPATQATLRTFHYAGSAEVSVTSGMDRIQEVADALKRMKTPSMKIYLLKPYNTDEQKAREFARSIIETNLSDVAKIHEDFFAKEIAIEFNEKALEERGLDKKEVLKKIEQKLKKKATARGKLYVFSYKKEKVSLAKLRKITQSLERMHLAGVRGITYATLVKEGDEFVVVTRGTNLRTILRRKEVDWTRTYSNDIHEVAEVLGIEAARYLIIEELFNAYMGAGGLFVDKRHLTIVADAMTRDGVIKPIGRTGIAGEKGSVLARAAFEETGKHLTEAAIWGEEDHLKGVVENLIVGLPVKVGTGRIKLTMKLG